MATTEERVLRLVREHVSDMGGDAKAVTPESNLTDSLNFDSLDLVEMMIYLEGEFDVEVSDAQLEGVRTVGDAIALMDRKLDPMCPA